MPVIKQYEATGKITPSNEGYTAFEQAGRRIGPLYQQAAQDREKEGQLTAELFNLEKFAFTIDPEKRMGFSVKGGVGPNPLAGMGLGMSSGRLPSVSNRVPYTGPDIATGAAALTRLANNMLGVSEQDIGSPLGIGLYGKGGIAPTPDWPSEKVTDQEASTVKWMQQFPGGGEEGPPASASIGTDNTAATTQDQETKTMNAASPGYILPEQPQDQSAPSPAVDINNVPEFGGPY